LCPRDPARPSISADAGRIGAAEVKRPRAAEDPGLWGTWDRVSAEVGGQPADDKGQARLVITAGRFEFQAAGREPRPGTYTLDPAHSPHAINLVVAVPSVVRGGAVIDPDRGTVAGIYKVEDDTLTLCLDVFGSGRPTQFFSGGGERPFALFVYRRATP
jgi:uncharacterized protein (TIGR03067 family)